MYLPITAEQLREKIDVARARKKEKQREAGKEFIGRFTGHIENLLDDPYKFTTHTVYSEELKGDMYDSNLDPTFFIDWVANVLHPLGYRVEKSHDGGGVHETIVVRWDIERPRKFGDLYAPGTK